MNSSRKDTTEKSGWGKTARGPWVVMCAVATVILGPAAVTASALDQANQAPLRHEAHEVWAAEPSQAYLATDTTRRRTATNPA